MEKVSSTAYQPSSRIGSQLKIDSITDHEQYKLTRLPHFKKEEPDFRGEDYAMEKSTIKKSSKIENKFNLSYI